MKATLTKRLERIEARLTPVADPVAAWREAYRRGASIAERLQGSSPEWVAMVERQRRLIAEMMADFGEDWSSPLWPVVKS